MNTQHLILSPTGNRLFKVGDVCHAQFTHGEYHVSIEWLNEGRECEPVMCIWSPTSVDGGVFAICLSSIGKYADPSGNPTPKAFAEAWRALPVLGRAQIDQEVYRLLDVILRHTPDLIRCPPQPPAMRQAESAGAFFEVTKQTEDGRVISEDTI